MADAFQLPSKLYGLSQAAAQSCAGCWPGAGGAAPGSSLPLQFLCFPNFYLQWWQCREVAWGTALQNRQANKRSQFRKAVLLSIKTAWEPASPSLVYWVIKGKCIKCHHCCQKSSSAHFPRGKWCLEREKTSERQQQLIIWGDPQNHRTPLTTKTPNFLDGLNKCGYCFLTFSLNSNEDQDLLSNNFSSSH